MGGSGSDKPIGASQIAFVVVFLTMLSPSGIQPTQDGHIVTSNNWSRSVAETFRAGPFAELSRESSRSHHLVWIKYRPTPVDLADPRFEFLDTSRSSFVTGAWYDESNSYMVIGLKGTYYHYCRMPRYAWDSFRSSDSFGRHYNRFIKGQYDCRLGGVPDY